MILVTGATGGVGGALVSRLSTAGTPTRALVRTGPRADDLRGYDVEVAVGDYADEASLRAAVAGVDRVFLADRMSSGLATEEEALLRVLAEVAPTARVVVLATAGVDGDPVQGGRFVQAHADVVAAVRAAGLQATVLAPAPAMQDLLGCASAVQSRGVLPSPTAQAPVAWVDQRDVAALAEHVLTSDGHEGATYTVTGPEAVTGEQVAQALAQVLGRDVAVEALEPDAQRTGLAGQGLDDWTVEGTLEHEAWLREGGVATTTEEVRKATGREARSVQAFLQEHAAAFR